MIKKEQLTEEDNIMRGYHSKFSPESWLAPTLLVIYRLGFFPMYWLRLVM